VSKQELEKQLRLTLHQTSNALKAVNDEASRGDQKPWEFQLEDGTFPYLQVVQARSTALLALTMLEVSRGEELPQAYELPASI
jgi:hypothetical protein